MIKTIIIDPLVENEFEELFKQMFFTKCDRHLTGGVHSPIVVALTFTGGKKNYHEDFYFCKNDKFYSLGNLQGFGDTDFFNPKPIEKLEEDFIKYMGSYRFEHAVEIKTLPRNETT